MTEIAVLVPVLARPHRVQPLVESIRAATTVPHRVLFICSPGDDEQILACEQWAPVTMVVDWQPGPADYARKIQAGFDATTAPFVFTGADDLDFQPGWDTAALERIEADQAGVCGTNDGGNRAVMAGLHSTHSLVRRAYIDECGGTFDETPGVVYSEAYSHQQVDNELVEVARARGCFTFAHDSRVTHLHPLWGTAPDDATYRKALADGREDRKLYERRRRAWVAGGRHERAART